MIDIQKEGTVIRDFLIEEFPKLIENEPGIRRSIVRISRDQFANRAETDNRFETLIQELRDDRERQKSENREYRKEQDEKWKKWLEEYKAENREYRKEQDEKWNEWLEEYKAENRKYRKEQDEKWEAYKAENREYRKEQDEKWEKWLEAYKAENRQIQQEWNQKFDKTNNRLDSTLGAIGARWGLQAESSFRAGLRAILQDHLGIEVLNVVEKDEQGVVFGRPDQIELDVIIKNGKLIICEIKSSIGRPDVFTFHRKVQFYQDTHERTADALMMISPMVQDDGRQFADQLGIQIFSHADDVTL